MSEFWTAWPDVMRKKLGAPARKISIDAGFTCPNRDGTVGTGGCIFCSNEAFSPSVKINQLSIEEQIRKSLIRFRANGKKERYLAFFQPFSNTHAPVDKLEELYSRALQVEGIDGLIVSTRPDCVDAPKAELLKKLAINHYVSLELGVQSIYEESLTWMNRGHDYSAVKDAISLFADSQIDICLHVILGLPGEGGESAKATARELALLNYHSIKLHSFHVLKNTPMETEFHAGRLHIPTMAEHVAMAADFLENTPKHIAVQRISGDAPKEYIIAPEWCLNKSEIRRELEEEFRRRKSFQGSAL